MRNIVTLFKLQYVALFYRMTLVEKELVTAREISEREEIYDPTNPDPTSSWHQYIFPYLPVTYLGILCIVGIISNSLVIFFFAACPVVSHFSLIIE